MPIKKPTFQPPQTADLKKSLDRLSEYVKDVKNADGSVDMSDLEEKVARSRTDHVAEGLEAVKDEFTRTRTRTVSSGCGGGTTTREVEVPAEKLQASEVQSVIQALMAAKSKVDGLDNDGDGEIALDEMGGHASSLSGKLARAGAHGARGEFEEAKTAWTNAVLEARDTVATREEFHETLEGCADFHAETKTGRDAIEWAYRELATRYPDDLYDIEVDSLLDDAEAKFLRAVPWDGTQDTSRGHLSDAEVMGFLGTDDLKGFIKDKQAEVKKAVGSWDDWVSGKDLAGHAGIDDPDIDDPYSTPSSGGC
jgi:hypothetical protein